MPAAAILRCMTHPKAPMRKAPGQRGGHAWLGPRAKLTVRVPLDVAAILRMQAKARKVPVSDLLASVLIRETQDL